MKTYNYILNKIEKNKSCFTILIDPDNINKNRINALINKCNSSKVDLIFIGGSLMLDVDFDLKIQQIKSITNIPVIVFPGGLNQISKFADALLFLSLISGRNPEYLIGNQVIAAPIVKKYNLEALSTAYMIIESGQTTSAEFMSGSKPIPRNKIDIALAHAMAAEILGFKLIYLEAGSGADKSVPNEMISVISQSVNTPLIVGGGIKSPLDAFHKVQAGAKIVVIGNHFENSDDYNIINEFSEAIHQ